MCTCNTGYSGNGTTCTAIDSCQTNNGGCDSNALCASTGPGANSCTCDTGYSGDGKTCAAIDSCQTNNGGCVTHAICTSTGAGTNTCACDTADGYYGTGTISCTDPCDTANGGCDSNATCTPSSATANTCACNINYTGNGYHCVGNGACGVNNGGCDSNATCTILTGGTIQCACNAPYFGDGTTCTDPCDTSNGGCDLNHATCTATGETTETCSCNLPYYGDGTTCTDPCMTSNGGCDQNATCTPTGAAAETCACNTGYVGDGHTCTLACTSDASCGGATPVCDTATQLCEQCTTAEVSACTAAPDSGLGCYDATHLYTATCLTDQCSYGQGSSCTNGCWQNACNTTGPSFDGDATAVPGTLDKELNLNASTGSEQAAMDIVALVRTTPINSFASVTLTYTTDNFTTMIPVPCTRGTPAGSDDVWSATIPAQASGTTVRFYYEGVDYSSNASWLPGSDINYTYVTQ